MHTITVISATNRVDSHTEKIARYYQSVLENKSEKVELLSLKELPPTIIETDLYGKRSVEFQKIIDAYIIEPKKVFFICPEYNGSFAGVLKVFLDAVHPKMWLDKKACLTGISSGRAGNLRGLEHLTNILNYLKINVYYNKLPISIVDTLLDETGALTHADTIKQIDIQIEGFQKF